MLFTHLTVNSRIVKPVSGMGRNTILPNQPLSVLLLQNTTQNLLSMTQKRTVKVSDSVETFLLIEATWFLNYIKILDQEKY